MTLNKQLERARAIKAAHEQNLMGKANVVGVGIGLGRRGGTRTDEPLIVVSVTHKVPLSDLAPDDVIPRQIDGISVDVQAVGTLQAQ